MKLRDYLIIKVSGLESFINFVRHLRCMLWDDDNHIFGMTPVTCNSAYFSLKYKQLIIVFLSKYGSLLCRSLDRQIMQLGQWYILPN